MAGPTVTLWSDSAECGACMHCGDPGPVFVIRSSRNGITWEARLCPVCLGNVAREALGFIQCDADHPLVMFAPEHACPVCSAREEERSSITVLKGLLREAQRRSVALATDMEDLVALAGMKP